MKITLAHFSDDEQGRSYTDVMNGSPKAFGEVLELLSHGEVPISVHLEREDRFIVNARIGSS